MLRLLETPDLALAQTVKFLCSEDGNYQTLKEMVSEFPATQLVSTFSYLSYWISDTLSKHKLKYNDGKIQQCLHLLNLIFAKVPPLILMNGSFDLNWGISQPHWALQEFYQKINKRITIIRSYIKPQSAFGQIYPFPLSNEFKEDYYTTFNPNLSIDLGIDQDYQYAAKNHFKKLLRNRAHQQMFESLLDSQMKQVLTQAIIELIDEVNEDPNLTHEQMISTFSSLFFYISSFSFHVYVDAQKLCEYIKTCDYLSPAFALSIISVFSNNLCHFQYLMPKVLMEDQNSEFSGYNIVDRTSDNKLSDFFSMIPDLVKDYFSSGNFSMQQRTNEERSKIQTQDTLKNDLDSLLKYFHNPKIDRPTKFKSVYMLALSTPFPPIYVVSMFMVPTRYLNMILTLNNSHSEFIAKFFTYIIAFITPTSDKANIPLFIFHRDEKLMDGYLYLYIRGLGTKLISIAINSPMEKCLPYCISAVARYPRTSRLTHCDYHHIFRRILVADVPILGPNILEAIERCSDIVILSMYADALSNVVHTHTSKGRDDIRALRNKILNRLPIKIDETLPYIQIEEFNTPSREFSEISYNIFLDVIHMTLESIKEINIDNCIFCIFSASLPMRRNFAQFVVDFLSTRLLSYNDTPPQELLPLTECNKCIPLAELCLPRLLMQGNLDLAETLAASLAPALAEDELMLHWLIKFCAEYRDFITADIKKSLRGALFKKYGDKLPDSEDFRQEHVYQFADRLVAAENPKVFDPDTMMREFTSPYLFEQALFRAFILLSPQSDKDIMEYLTKPIYEVRLWKHRNECVQCLAKLAATMSSNILYEYYRKLMANDPCDLSVVAGRIFLAMIRIDIFESILDSCSASILRNSDKLDFFMRIALPSFHRLHGNFSCAKDFLCGLMVSVTDQTPRSLQEAVIDAVGLIYMKLKLFDYRKEIINSASAFSPDLKSVIACSLDPDVAKQSGGELFKVKDPHKQKMKEKPPP